MKTKTNKVYYNTTKDLRVIDDSFIIQTSGENIMKTYKEIIKAKKKGMDKDMNIEILAEFVGSRFLYEKIKMNCIKPHKNLYDIKTKNIYRITTQDDNRIYTSEGVMKEIFAGKNLSETSQNALADLVDYDGEKNLIEYTKKKYESLDDENVPTGFRKKTEEEISI